MFSHPYTKRDAIRKQQTKNTVKQCLSAAGYIYTPTALMQNDAEGERGKRLASGHMEMHNLKIACACCFARRFCLPGSAFQQTVPGMKKLTSTTVSPPQLFSQRSTVVSASVSHSARGRWLLRRPQIHNLGNVGRWLGRACVAGEATVWLFRRDARAALRPRRRADAAGAAKGAQVRQNGLLNRCGSGVQICFGTLADGQRERGAGA